MKKRIIAFGAGAILITTLIVSTVVNEPTSEPATVENMEFDPQKAHQEVVPISEAAMNDLADYEVIGDVHINYQESISIPTTADQSTSEEMYKVVSQTLNSQELAAIPWVDSYDTIIKRVYKK